MNDRTTYLIILPQSGIGMDLFKNSNKKYGLIIPAKKSKSNLAKSSAFNGDDSDEDMTTKKSYNKPSKLNNFIKKQAQLDIEKALLEDPNCFEYDAVYEEEQAKRLQQKEKSKSQDADKPKYIASLMKAAEQRKKEYERRVERTVQKERDAEKGMYEDKEAFVTSAYKEKMKRIKEEEEMERRQQALDEMQSSEKDKDFTGFYRNILNQKTGGRTDESFDRNHVPSSSSSSLLSCKDRHLKIHQNSSKESKRKFDDNTCKEKIEFNYSKTDERRASTSSQPTSHHYEKEKHSRSYDEKKDKKNTKRKSNERHSDSSDSDSKISKKIKKDDKRNEIALEKIIGIKPAEVEHTGDTDDESVLSSSSSSDEETEIKPDNKNVSKQKVNVKKDNLIDTSTKNEVVAFSQKVTTDDRLEKNTVVAKHEKTTVGDAFNDARARFLARKMAKANVPIVSSDD